MSPDTLPAPSRVLVEHGEALTRQVLALTITSAQGFEDAASMSRSVAAFISRVKEVMDPVVNAAHNAHKVAVAQRDALLRPAEGAKRIIGERMAAYTDEQARLRREAEAAQQRERERLEAEARQAAEVERLRLQEQADRAAAAVAEQLARDGEPDLAGLIKAPAVPLPAPKPVYLPPLQVNAPPAARGMSFPTTWSAEIVDLMALVKAIAAGTQPITLIEANMVALNGLARALKDALAIPGVRAKSTRGAATRTAPAAGVEW